jgi:hypothetical protein
MITGVFMETVVIGADALSDGSAAELSFLSSSQFADNDTTGSILGLECAQGFLTTGGGQVRAAQYVPMDVPVNSGERIFLHIQVRGSPTEVLTRAWIFIEEKPGSSRARVARR